MKSGVKRNSTFKRLITAILLCALTIACFSVLGIVLNKESNTKPEEPKAADLTISNYSQLKAFAESVNSGNDYSGKTVVLSQNIDCIIHDIGTIYTKQDLPCIGSGSWNSFTGGTINRFNGIFDGNGFAIYNFTLTGGAYFQTREIIGQKKYRFYHYYYQALFVDIGSSAQINNLKVYNYARKSQSHLDTSVNGHEHQHYDRHYALVANYNTNGSISKCWIPSGDYSGVASATNIMLSGSIINANGETLTSAGSRAGLDWSSDGGAGGTIWYYKSGYNSGWAKLRIFISWTTYYFKSEDSNKGTVSATEKIVPADCAGASTSGRQVVFDCGGSVDAREKPAYSFSHWAKSGNTYTAHFVDKICEITFWNFSDDIVVETKNLSLDTDYNLAYGANLKITYTYCEKREQQYTYWGYNDYGYEVEMVGTAYCLNALTFEFTDTDGIYRIITYRPKNATQCIGVDVKGIEGWPSFKRYKEGNNPYEPYTMDCFEDPMLLDKEYNITFG